MANNEDQIIDAGEEEERRLTKAERKVIRRQEKQLAKIRQEKAERRKRWGIWAGAAVVVIAILAGSAGLARQKNRILDEIGDNGNRLTLEVSDDDWIIGNKAAGLTVVEYADLQCPACAVFHKAIKELNSQYPDQVRFVYRHYPLTNIHPNAEEAALAVEAAGQQGKFWEMVDRLYDRQTAWSQEKDPQEILAGYASEIGLDAGRWREDMKRDDLMEKVTKQMRSGEAAGVNATPTFFINGEKMTGYSSIDSFKENVRQ